MDKINRNQQLRTFAARILINNKLNNKESSSWHGNFSQCKIIDDKKMMSYFKEYNLKFVQVKRI